MQTFNFDFKIDSANYKKIVIKDNNNYPLHNVETHYSYENITVLGSGGTGYCNIEVLLEVMPDNIKYGRILKFLTGPYAGQFYSISSTEQNDSTPSAEVFTITLYADLEAQFTQFDFAILTNVIPEIPVIIPPNNSAINRSNYAMFMFVTSKISTGDVNISFPILDPFSIDTWSFDTDNGGWYIMRVYAIKRYAMVALPYEGNPSYQADEIVWENQNGIIRYFISQGDNNEEPLPSIGGTDLYWKILQGNPTEQQLINACNTINSFVDNAYRYYANFFIMKKLLVMTDKYNLKMDCSCECSDPCRIQDNLKLAMYIEQINSMINLGIYNKAEETYEKAIQLVQDISK